MTNRQLVDEMRRRDMLDDEILSCLTVDELATELARRKDRNSPFDTVIITRRDAESIVTLLTALIAKIGEGEGAALKEAAGRIGTQIINQLKA